MHVAEPETQACDLLSSGCANGPNPSLLNSMIGVLYVLYNLYILLTYCFVFLMQLIWLCT